MPTHRPFARAALVAALALVPLAAARAQDAPPPSPLEGFVAPREARATRFVDSPLDRAERFVLGLARRSRLARGLAPKTTGDFRVAILLVELADSPRPPLGPEAWQRALFSEGEYHGRGNSGEALYGSVRDYYLEQSAGKLRLGGRVFDWVKVPARRAELETQDWSSLRGRRSLFTAALDALVAREGPRVLDGFDALGFVVSGGLARKYDSLVWPHSSALLYRGRPWRYYLMHSGTARMEPIGTHAHELGHVLGLPDKYGSGPRAGAGIYCLMAQGNYGANDRWIPVDAPPLAPLEAARREAWRQLDEGIDSLTKRFLEPHRASRWTLGDDAPPDDARPDEDPVARDAGALFCEAPILAEGAGGDAAGAARPLHLCAVCKTALGWVRPVAVDARVEQRLYLEPVEEHADEVLALGLGRSGERAILEYRGRRGFDAGLPRSGLLVWRTGLPGLGADEMALSSNAELVAAHGIATVDAAHRGPDAVMFPWADHTGVVLAPRLACGRGGEGVRVSGIREEGGRVYFSVGPSGGSGR